MSSSGCLGLQARVIGFEFGSSIRLQEQKTEWNVATETASVLEGLLSLLVWLKALTEDGLTAAAGQSGHRKTGGLHFLKPAFGKVTLPWHVLPIPRGAYLSTGLFCAPWRGSRGPMLRGIKGATGPADSWSWLGGA